MSASVLLPSLFFLGACAPSTQWAGANEVATTNARRIEIEAAEKGFRPEEIRARVGESITLNVTRTGRDSCLQRVIVHLTGERRIERELPLGKTVAITLHLTTPGELGLTCSKDGHAATIYVDPEVKQ